MSQDWPGGRWFIDRGGPDDLKAYRLTEILVQGRTRYQEYQIISSPVLGKALILDGVLQSAQADEVIYHEALVRPPAAPAGGGFRRRRRRHHPGSPAPPGCPAPHHG